LERQCRRASYLVHDASSQRDLAGDHDMT
jgi:hypothetical protein